MARAHIAPPEAGRLSESNRFGSTIESACVVECKIPKALGQSRLPSLCELENDVDVFAIRQRCFLFPCVVIFGLLITGCADSAAPVSSSDGDLSPRTNVTTDIRFDDVTALTGIDFLYRNGEEAGEVAVLESLGGGVALFDLDGDGDLDVCCPGGGHYSEKTPDGKRDVLGWPHAIFRNDGDWKFTDVTVSTVLPDSMFYSHGAFGADFDNDGFSDLLITGYGGVLLLHNQGDGTFEESARPSGLTTNSWSCAAGWGDFNNDGALDLYIANYLNWSFEVHPYCPVSPSQPNVREICPPAKFQGLSDVLYLSNGDGTFRDASRECGLQAEGKGLGVVVADLNLDGQVDIFVGNDMVPNFQYHNLGNAKFEEVAAISGTAFDWVGSPQGSMGVDIGDFDRDGRPDLAVANITVGGVAVYHNDNHGHFHHASKELGIYGGGGLSVSWGTAFSDFDHDGDEDLFVSNGGVVRYDEESMKVLQLPLMFENVQGQRFTNVAPAAGAYFREAHNARGFAIGDIDNDGLVDLMISRLNQRATALRNTTKSANRWLSLELIGRSRTRTPIGTIVKVTTSQGFQVQQIKGGSSYASTSDRRLNIGLGTDELAKVEIFWPNGESQILPAVASNTHWIVVEGSAPIAKNTVVQAR